MSLSRHYPKLLFLGLTLWILLWEYRTKTYLQNFWPYYCFAMNSTKEQLKAYNCIYDQETKNYYSVLNMCNTLVPPNEKIQIAFPPLLPQAKFEFLREKGRYHLYPRNYGANSLPQKYILVYQDWKFKPNAAYETIHDFGSHVYLLRLKESLQVRK